MKTEEEIKEKMALIRTRDLHPRGPRTEKEKYIEDTINSFCLAELAWVLA